MPAEVVAETGNHQTYPARVLRIDEVFGQKKQSDDPNEQVDLRVVDCVLALDDKSALRIGQRVLVRIYPGDQVVPVKPSGL